MTQEVETVATVAPAVVAWILSSVAWTGISVAVYFISMNNRRKKEAFPYVITLTILWPLILLVQGVTHILPGTRAVIEFVPRCFRAFRTFAGILSQGTQATLQGKIPQLPEKKATHYY